MHTPNEFFGEDVRNAIQPRGTQLCFPALLAGYAETSVTTAHQALMGQNITFEDGSTPQIMQRKIIPIENTIVTMEPITTPLNGIEEVDEIVDIIDSAHRGGNPVTMLYQKTNSEAKTYPHWVTLCGFFENEEGAKVQVVLNDPEDIFQNWVPPKDLEAMIESSIPTTGLYAYALSKAGVESPAGRAS